MNHIKKYRIRSGMSQKILAEKIGIKQSMLSRIESGQRPLTTDRMRQIAIALGLKSWMQLEDQTNHPKSA